MLTDVCISNPRVVDYFLLVISLFVLQVPIQIRNIQGVSSYYLVHNFSDFVWWFIHAFWCLNFVFLSYIL